MTAPSSSMGRLAPRLCLLQCLLTLAAGPRASASPHQPAPPPPQPAPSSPARWAAQRASWESLLRDMEPLARQGAPMPSVKLGRHFRRQGRWPHPSFDPRKASDRERALLAPKGPAALPSTRGPAGRAVWVECGASGAPTPAARELCRLAEATCGLSCTFAPALPAGSSTPPRALLRSLRRLRLDHALALSLDGPGGQLGLFVPSPHATDLAAHSARTPSPAVPTADTLRPLILAAAAPLGQRSLRLLPQPLFRLTLGLQLPAPGAKPAPTPPQAIAEALCRLGSGLPDEVMRAWRGTDAARQARALAISRWMGLSFEERPVEKGRPPLEQRYVRIHYRDRVFNFRQRPSDKAVLIQPLMVVIHDTGGTSLSSALHTLRAKQIGRGQGPGHTPGSLSVGVPYLVGRDGLVNRLFDDDSRFARHTIGLNHSAIGIENVGNRHHPLSPLQIESNARLVEYASLRYPIRWLLGHREVYQMGRTSYYLEAIPGYCSDKNDPPFQSLKALRTRLEYLQLESPPEDLPVLKSCADLLRFFRLQRKQGHGRDGSSRPERAPR